jgi:hypothetical protein
MKPVSMHTPYSSDVLVKSIVRNLDCGLGWPFWMVVTQDPEQLRKVVEEASILLGYCVVPVPGQYWEKIRLMPYDDLAGNCGELRQLITNNRRSILFCNDLSMISAAFLYWLAYNFCEVEEISESDKDALVQRPVFVGGYIWGRSSKECLNPLSHFSYRSCELIE